MRFSDSPLTKNKFLLCSYLITNQLDMKPYPSDFLNFRPSNTSCCGWRQLGDLDMWKEGRWLDSVPHQLSEIHCKRCHHAQSDATKVWLALPHYPYKGWRNLWRELSASCTHLILLRISCPSTQNWFNVYHCLSILSGLKNNANRV